MSDEVMSEEAGTNFLTMFSPGATPLSDERRRFREDRERRERRSQMSERQRKRGGVRTVSAGAIIPQ